MSLRRPAIAALGTLLMASAASAGAQPSAPPSVHHDLSIVLDPVQRTLRATDRLTIDATGTLTIELASRFTLTELEVNGAARAVPRPTEQAGVRRWSLDGTQRGRQNIVVHYAGELQPLEERDHRETLETLPPMAGARGAFLPAGTGWYPELGATHLTYRITIEVPSGQRALVPGRLVAESAGMGAYRATFEFTRPVEGIDLMAGPFQVTERMLVRPGRDPIRLRTWLHPEVAELAPGYLDAAARYFDLYEPWIGAYPYSEFSIVSSPLPTGFGMPTLTYLGVDVLRLPFIKATSLGHEILHNWWGNGVYPDWARGNWSEGLTTFMADYTYKELESPEAARTMRMEWLRDFAAVPPSQDTPLRGFTTRTHGTSQIVGYNKAAFLFLMLRDTLGHEAFDAGLQRFWSQRQFRPSSWEDLRQAFELASGRDLGAFFEQWLDRTGAPRLRIESAKRYPAGAAYRVEFDLVQDTPPFTVRVPIALELAGRTLIRHVDVTQPRQHFIFELDARPEALALDPDLRVFRRLQPRELPPILRQVMLSASTATVIASEEPSMQEAGRALAAKLLDHGVRAPQDGEHGPLLLIGLEEDVDRVLSRSRLPARPASLRGHGSAQVWAAYDESGQTVVCVAARDAGALQALMRPLPHYGRQSWLIFEGSKAIERGMWPGETAVVRLSG